MGLRTDQQMKNGLPLWKHGGNFFRGINKAVNREDLGGNES
jgi:hypothetical protein